MQKKQEDSIEQSTEMLRVEMKFENGIESGIGLFT